MQETIILTLNTWMASSPLLIKTVPLLADVFVFSYPFYLLYLYFSSDLQKNGSKNIQQYLLDKEQKYHALSIFFATVTSLIINYIIKSLIDQQRPYHSIDLAINPKESLILNHIPTDAFPSDHAALSMAIAVTTLILGYKSKNNNMIVVGWIFILFSLVMGLSRITMGLHRPTDIIGGIIVGGISSLIITNKTIQSFLYSKIYSPVVQIQENIFSKIRF